MEPVPALKTMMMIVVVYGNHGITAKLVPETGSKICEINPVVMAVLPLFRMIIIITHRTKIEKVLRN